MRHPDNAVVKFHNGNDGLKILIPDPDEVNA
jgi:hypothetical protein